MRQENKNNEKAINIVTLLLNKNIGSLRNKLNQGNI